MSDEKRVIRVKDLVIEAENVIINPRRREREFDPIFGRQRRQEEDRFESSNRESDDRRDDDGDRRRSIWI